MENSKKYNALERLIMPKGIEDPELIALLRPLIPQNFSNLVTYAITALILWHLNLNKAAFVAFCFYTPMAILGLVVLRMGYHKFYRLWLFILYWICISSITVLMGQESFFWVWYLVNIAATPFLALEREKGLRLFSYIGNASVMILTLLAMIFKIFPVEATPDQRQIVLNFGIFTVIYAGSCLTFFVLRFHKETILYKNRLNDQSVTMVQHAKMSSLGEMAAGVAHEINNPLGIIRGKMDGLIRRVRGSQFDGERFVEDCEKVNTVVTRIAKIVSALRTFSKESENDPFQSNKMEDIINDILFFCSENLKINKIEMRITGNQSFELECRPSQIGQVLINMINNSFDAIRDLPEKWIEITLEVVGDRTRITIADSGQGIPPAVAEKIMQPFFTTKEIGKGTGLGLSVSKGIIETHGGTLELDTNSRNTRFLIELPLRH